MNCPDMERHWLVVTNTFLSLLISTVIKADANLATTWVRAREDDVIGGKTRRMEIFNPSVVSCARACIQFNWCSIFVMSEQEGKCELFQTEQASLNYSSSSHRSGLYRLQQISEDNPDGCPVDAGFVFSPAAQFCFLVLDNTTATWDGSKSECARRGLRLAVPDTPLKMAALLKVVSTTSGNTNAEFFIGASRPTSNLTGRWTEEEGIFDWITGTRIGKDFLRPFWAKNKPDDEGCLTIAQHLESLLNDVDCDKEERFICEKTLY